MSTAPQPSAEPKLQLNIGGQLRLAGRKILIVEDDCLVAEDFAAMLREVGATVIGPAESLPQALRMAQECDGLDCALLDIDLDGIMVFPLALQLQAEGVPMLFLTGAGCDQVPDELAGVPCIGKPTASSHVVEELIALLRRGPATP